MTDRKQLARCTGQCCTRLPLITDTYGQMTLDQLAEMVVEERNSDSDIAKDKRVILDMVIPFEGPWTEQGDGGRYENWRHGPVYTCKYFDGKDCGIYEDRPDLCKRYGVKAGVPCMFEDCEMQLEPAPLLDAGSLTKKMTVAAD